MQYAIVTVPAAPVRKKPDHRAEMSSQLLFGEAVKILKTRDGHWLKIESLFDGYQGWITHHLVTHTQKTHAVAAATKLTVAPLSVINVNGLAMHIPAGSSLVGLEGNEGGFEDFRYTFDGPFTAPVGIVSKIETLLVNAKSWLNAPYLWGGKTLLGVDCSGFAQTQYKLIGVPLARDAWQQAQQGATIKKLKDAQPGDLAFFDDKDEIVHVGILLGTDKIIHAAGKVRIDPIDSKGIVNADTGKRTHRLKLIKRFL